MRDTHHASSTLMVILDKFSTLALLNILTVVCSIPLFTIGASTTALYYSIRKYKEGEASLFRTFFHSFRENFKQATILWVVLLLVGGALLFAILLSGYVGHLFVKIISVIALIIWCAIVSWLFPLLSKFCFQTKSAIHNAFLCSVGYWPVSLLMVVTNFLPLALLLVETDIFVKIGFLWIIIWFSLAAVCNHQLLKDVFSSLEKTILQEANTHDNE